MKTTATTRDTLIAQYRQLGEDMKTLREEHIKEKEALINKYRADKAALQQQRYDLLTKIRTTGVTKDLPEVEDTNEEAAA